MTSFAPPPYHFNDSRQQQPQKSKMDRFKELIQRYEISEYFATKLRQLEKYEIVLILDDSGSMSTPVPSPNQNAYTPIQTRWDELKATTRVVVEIATCLDADGIDLYFLNRGKISNCFSNQVVEDAFAAPPCGYTPISRILRQVFKDKAAVLVEKKMLLILATDGEPSNDSGTVDIATMKHILTSERDPYKVAVSILVCSDDESTVSYLNEMDVQIPGLDVVDDYQSERKEVLKAQGPKFPFSFGDYVVKLLLGSIDPDIDNLDEIKTSNPNRSSSYEIQTPPPSIQPQSCCEIM